MLRAGPGAHQEHLVNLRQLQHTEDVCRAAHPSWMDLDVAPDDIKTQWQEANANRRMQFKVGDHP